jgi:hypothetical protein
MRCCQLAVLLSNPVTCYTVMYNNDAEGRRRIQQSINTHDEVPKQPVHCAMQYLVLHPLVLTSGHTR